MGCADELSAPWAGRSVQVQRPAVIGSLWLATSLRVSNHSRCLVIDLGQDCLLRIVTFPSGAQTPNMVVLPLSLAEDSANPPPGMARRASVLPRTGAPFSCLRLEHCGLAPHECVALLGRRDRRARLDLRRERRDGGGAVELDDSRVGRGRLTPALAAGKRPLPSTRGESKAAHAKLARIRAPGRDATSVKDETGQIAEARSEQSAIADRTPICRHRLLYMVLTLPTRRRRYSRAALGRRTECHDPHG
jgi:hypothetical protein